MIKTILATMALLSCCLAHATGELTIFPSYYLSAKAFDMSRIGLYINEPISTKWSYTSWTGCGKAFVKPPGDNVTWYSTSQDFIYNVHENFQAGGGGGFNYSEPSHFNDSDVHLRLSVKLW